MSKQKSNPVLKNLDDYIQVTRKNMKLALGVGDNFYIIKQAGDKYEIRGHGDITPRLRPGQWKVTGMPHGINNYVNFEFYIREEQTPNEYKENFGPIFQLVDMGVVYVNKHDRRKTIYELSGDTSANPTKIASALTPHEKKIIPTDKPQQADFLNP